MSFTIKPMNAFYARSIAYWKYDGIYAFYNMEFSTELINELMNGQYMAVTGASEEIVGFFCYGSPAQILSGLHSGAYHSPTAIDIGLGMRPDLTGKGSGANFVNLGVSYAKKHFYGDQIRLTVATFNQRAIRAYEKAGFKRGQTFTSMIDGMKLEFMTMSRSLSGEK